MLGPKSKDFKDFYTKKVKIPPTFYFVDGMSSTINSWPFLKYPHLHLLSVIVSFTFGIDIFSSNPDLLISLSSIIQNPHPTRNTQFKSANKKEQLSRFEITDM